MPTRLLLVPVLALLAVAGCGEGDRPAAKPAGPVTDAPKVVLDSYARLACRRLDNAVRVRSKGGQTAIFDASLEEFNAHTDAARSSVPEVLEIVQRHDTANEGGEALYAELRAWCNRNWTPGS